MGSLRTLRRGLVGRALVGAALVGGALAVGACSILTSLDGYAGGAADAATEATDTTDASDAAPNPSTGPEDAASEADAGALGFCETQDAAVTLCEDFDVGPLTSGWDDQSSEHGGLLLDTTAFVSAPNALRAATVASNGSAEAYLLKNFNVEATEIHVALDVRPETFGNETKAVQVATFDVTDGTGDWHQIGLSFAGTDFMAFEYAPETDVPGLYEEYRTKVAPTLGKWTRVGMDVSLSAKTVSVTVDGAVDVAPTTIHPRVASGKVQVRVGIPFAPGPQDGSSLRVDNIVIDVR